MSVSSCADLLRQHGVFSESDLRRATLNQQQTGGSLGRAIARVGLMTEEGLADTLAGITDSPRLRLDQVVIEPNVVSMVEADWAIQSQAVPFLVDREHREILVALTDPADGALIEQISFLAGMTVRPVVGTETEIDTLIRHAFFGERLPGLSARFDEATPLARPSFQRQPKRVNRPVPTDDMVLGDFPNTGAINRHSFSGRSNRTVPNLPRVSGLAQASGLPQASGSESWAPRAEPTNQIRVLPMNSREMTAVTPDLFDNRSRSAKPPRPNPAAVTQGLRAVRAHPPAAQAAQPAQSAEAPQSASGDPSLDLLLPVLEEHERATAILEAIFRRAVLRGVIDEKEYLERLSKEVD